MWATSYGHEYQAIYRIEASPYGLYGALRLPALPLAGVAGSAWRASRIGCRRYCRARTKTSNSSGGSGLL
jgi:hypothetical protein